MMRQWRSLLLSAATFCIIMQFITFDHDLILSDSDALSIEERLDRRERLRERIDERAGIHDANSEIGFMSRNAEVIGESAVGREPANNPPETAAETPSPPILHIFQYGKPRTATTTQFNMVCVSLFLHTQLYHPELLNNTICNNADRWVGKVPKGDGFFLQNDEIPQAGKSHIAAPPDSIRNTTIVFTTAKTRTEALKKEAGLRRQGFNVGLVQDMETVVEAEIGGLVKQYAEFFKLMPEHIPLMTTYFEYWDQIRQCCGLQMSKYYRNELVPASKKKEHLKQHSFCGSVDINSLEEKYMDTDLYRLLDRYKLMRSINRPSLVDGDLNGTYCTRYSDAVKKHGITNKIFDGINSRYKEVENHWEEETSPTFEGLQHLIQKSKSESHGAEHETNAGIQTNEPERQSTDSSTQSVFSPWVQDYISFHKSSIESGKLKDDMKYIIYSCKDGHIECGGIGDRVIGMIKMFYLAMMTRRVLVMDSDFPIPLTEVLEPAHIEWNATYPDTTENFPDLIWRADGNNLSLRQDVRGYRILKTGGIPRKLALDDLWLSDLMTNHLKQHQWNELASSISLSAKAHEAIRAMFNYSPAVVSRAEEFKASAGITGPYIGMHMRKGDAAMGVEGPTARKNLGIDRTTNNNMMMECWQKMKNDHPKATVAYLASDDVKTKQNMSDSDPSIHFAKDMRPFHVDLLARSNFAAPLQIERTDPSVAQGVIDTWAEMLVLAQSTCFIVSKSMFSFGSLYLREPNDCAVFLGRCDVPSHRAGYYSYYGEAIYQRGFVMVENQTNDALD